MLFDSDEIIPTCPECWSMDVSDNDDLFLDFLMKILMMSG